jgi:hypothetical protein
VHNPSPSRLAVEGFARLATWYTQLVADHLGQVAQTVAEGRFDADAAAAAVTRSAALPFLGFAALANEVVDAAALQAVGVHATRTIESETFTPEPPGTVSHDRVHLVNGFGDELAGVEVVTDASGSGPGSFRLVARAVPADRTGVFRGTVVVTDARGARHEQPVWLVVP